MKVLIVIVCVAVVLALMVGVAQTVSERKQERAWIKDQCINIGYADVITWRDTSFCIGYSSAGEVRIMKTAGLE